MSKAIKFLERNTVFNTDDFGETTENVSIQDAITASLIQELETLQLCYTLNEEGLSQTNWPLHLRIEELVKKLKHIK